MAVCVTISLNAFDNHFNHPRQDKRISLDLSYQETDIVLRALGKLPLEESANVYSSIQMQIQRQVAASQQQKEINKDTIRTKKQ